MQMAKAVKKEKLSLLNLKVTSRQRKALESKARAHAKGNLSEWLRLAGTKYRPLKKAAA